MIATLPGLDPNTLHPSWCLQGFCEPDGPTVAHLSAPIVWRMAGSDVDVCMRRRQEGLAGPMLIELRLNHRLDPDESTLLFLTEDDLARLFSGIAELRSCD